MVGWVYDELVLVGDLVSQNGWRGVSALSREAQELSTLLRRGQLHSARPLPDNFRSPSSIRRKSYDILTADPNYRGSRTHGGRLDVVIAKAFRTDPAGMEAKAAAIKGLLEAGEFVPLDSGILDDEEAVEGGILEFLTRKRERDRGIRQRKVAQVKAAGGSIACEVCGFDFDRAYGERGSGYIEVHHRLPLHVTGLTTTRPSDLALLCANCHRMCHRGGWIEVEELTAIVRTRTSGR